MSYGGTSTDQSGAASWQLSPVNVAGVLLSMKTNQQHNPFLKTPTLLLREVDSELNCKPVQIVIARTLVKRTVRMRHSVTLLCGPRKSSTEINLKVTDWTRVTVFSNWCSSTTTWT